MKNLRDEGQHHDLKLPNMFQKLTQTSLAILMLLLTEWSVYACLHVAKEGEREGEIVVLISSCFEENGLESPSLTFIFLSLKALVVI